MPKKKASKSKPAATKKAPAKKVVAKAVPAKRGRPAKKDVAKAVPAKRGRPAKKDVAKKTPAKKVVAPKAPVKKAVVAPKASEKVIVVDRKGIISRNKEMRATLSGFTIAQLVAFFKGMDSKTVGRVKKSMSKIGDAKRLDEIKRTKAQINKLTQKLKGIKG